MERAAIVLRKSGSLNAQDAKHIQHGVELRLNIHAAESMQNSDL